MAGILLVFVIAVAVNLAWEMLQFPLYGCSETGRAGCAGVSLHLWETVS